MMYVDVSDSTVAERIGEAAGANVSRTFTNAGLIIVSLHPNVFVTISETSYGPGLI